MKVVEGFGGIGACDLLEHNRAARVDVEKVGKVIDFVVDYAPERVCSVM